MKTTLDLVPNCQHQKQWMGTLLTCYKCGLTFEEPDDGNLTQRDWSKLDREYSPADILSFRDLDDVVRRLLP